MEWDIKLAYQEKLKKFQDLFSSDETIKFQTELNIVTNALKNLEKKISFAVVGPPKSGKSKFLNALIGKDLLESNELNCSFFALEIQASEGEPSLFDSENNPIVGDIYIREYIKKQNEMERELKKLKSLKNEKNEVQVLKLRTPIKGLLTKVCGNIKYCYNFLQFIDLPGINDNSIHFNKEDIINNSKKIQTLQKTENNGSQFLECINKISIDFLIFLVSVDEIHKFDNFFFEAKKNLFSDYRKANFESLLNNKRIMILINKSDLINKNDEAEQRKNIIKRIFYQFYGRNIDKSQECIINMDVEEEKKQIEAFENDYKVRFISSHNAFKQIIFDEEKEKNKLKEIYGNDQESIEIKLKKRKQFDSYAESSEFNGFLLDIGKIIPHIFQEKFENDLKSDMQTLEGSKYVFLNKKKLLICREYLGKNFKTIEKKFESQFEISKRHADKIIENLPRSLKNNQVMKKITICEIHSHYFEIVSTFLQIFQQTLEDINNEYKKAIENCLNELNEAANIKSYFEKILDPLLNKTKKASLLEADNLLFSFIPDGINYSKNWIIYFIYSLFTKKETFQSCWVEFIKEFDEKINLAIKKLKKFHNVYFAREEKDKQNEKSLKSTFKDLWNLCKKLNDIYE